MSRIATLSGVALRPGVSKNGRRYTAEAIAKAFTRADARLNDPDGRPIVMRTFHPDTKSDLDVRNIAGRLTSVSLGEDGSLHYRAEIADTAAGRDVAALVTADQPFLRNVSIRGWWMGETRMDPDGAETGDDLEIDGLDYVANPGVEGATVAPAEGAPAGARLITESAEENRVTPESTDEANKQPYGDVAYADPGYQKDKKKRYPIDSKAHVRAAWSYVNKPENQKPYTAAQLKRIKGRIKSAAAKFGIKISEEAGAIALAALTEAFIEGLPEQIREAMACVSVSNGPADISVSAYGNDPADLQAVVGRLADAVLAALDAVDPDGDGDIDLPGDPDNGAGWSTESSPTGESNQAKEPTVADESNTQTAAASEAEQARALANMTEEEFTAHANEVIAEALKTGVSAVSEAERAEIIAQVLAAMKPAGQEAAAAQQVASTEAATQAADHEHGTEAAPEAAPNTAAITEALRKSVSEGLEAVKTQFTAEVESLRDDLVAVARATGRLPRKGMVAAEESGQPAKELHEMSKQELDEYANTVLGDLFAS